MKEVFLEPLDRCPACNVTLDKSGVCSNCGSTVYDFCGEHVRNHNGMTFIRFITESGVAVVTAQVSSHHINIDNSKFPNTKISLDVVGTVAMGYAPEKKVEEET